MAAVCVRSRGQAASAKTANDRIFGMLPNYQTVESGVTAAPLTARYKFTLAALQSFDPAEFGLAGVLAGVRQMDHENPSWGYGASGYARRYGETFGNQAIEDLMVTGTFASLLHQDPRYYQLGQGSFLGRFVYAASRLVVTRTDSGHATLNLSELGGSLAASGIANFYEPAAARTLRNTAAVWGAQVLVDGLANELCEFWPDIKHRLFH